MTTSTVILGSQSPRRFELLSLIVNTENIHCVPPLDSQEPGFEGIADLQEIRTQLKQIARLKNDDVVQQLAGKTYRCILTADTVVIVHAPTGFIVLGKPDGPGWQARVRHWFKDNLCGRSHQVTTAVCLSSPVQGVQEFLVTTHVTFSDYDDEQVEWYLSTQESLGKAGGYGVQSAGSMFVKEINGSLSNVIGLPILETRKAILNF